jgi:hypothetical protein
LIFRVANPRKRHRNLSSNAVTWQKIQVRFSSSSILAAVFGLIPRAVKAVLAVFARAFRFSLVFTDPRRYKHLQ